MNRHSPLRLSVLLLPLLAACASTMPSGPSVMVLPGSGKSFDQFRLDENDCRGYAQAGIGNATPGGASDESGLRSAAVGTALGAVAGAAANGSRGAGVGAGAGMALGGLAGVSAGQSSAGGVQRRYDMAYQQCMYAKGHKIPGSPGMFSSGFSGYGYSPSPSSYYSQTPPPPPSQPAPAPAAPSAPAR